MYETDRWTDKYMSGIIQRQNMVMQWGNRLKIVNEGGIK